MASYNDTFKLSIKDIELIEEALRNEISLLSDRIRTNFGTGDGDVRSCNDTIRELHQVLGRLHNQKIWYGQVRETGVPLSG
jgi:hypothetical protein